jgi:hypothetical protein
VPEDFSSCLSIAPRNQRWCEITQTVERGLLQFSCDMSQLPIAILGCRIPEDAIRRHVGTVASNLQGPIDSISYEDWDLDTIAKQIGVPLLVVRRLYHDDEGDTDPVECCPVYVALAATTNQRFDVHAFLGSSLPVQQHQLDQMLHKQFGMKPDECLVCMNLDVYDCDMQWVEFKDTNTPSAFVHIATPKLSSTATPSSSSSSLSAPAPAQPTRTRVGRMLPTSDDCMAPDHPHGSLIQFGRTSTLGYEERRRRQQEGLGEFDPHPVAHTDAVAEALSSAVRRQ